MKVIVFQTLLDKGYIGQDLHINGKPSENLLIIKTCMESVRAWCSKNNYEYALCQENLNWTYAANELSSLGYEDIPKHGYDLCAQRHELLSKYDADLKIVLDNDVWVHLDFELRVENKNLMRSDLPLHLDL